MTTVLLVFLALGTSTPSCWSFVHPSFVNTAAADARHGNPRLPVGFSTPTSLPTATSPYFQTTAISGELIQKFEKLRKAFPKDASIVKAGGWYNLERLSVDPKQELVGIVTEGLKSTEGAKVQFGSMYNSHDDEKLEALMLLLYGMGKGFDSAAIDGEWDLVFTKQGKKSPAFQKVVGSTEKAGLSKNFFDVASMTFSGIVKFWKWGRVGTKVKVGGH